MARVAVPKHSKASGSEISRRGGHLGLSGTSSSRRKARAIFTSRVGAAKGLTAVTSKTGTAATIERPVQHSIINSIIYAEARGGISVVYVFLKIILYHISHKDVSL